MDAQNEAKQQAVLVFDFDGVLCSPREDLVYKIAERPGELELLEQPARDFGIDPTLYDIRYLRHLVLQSLLLEQGVLPDPGPLLELAREVSAANRPFFVLTARSGVAAIRRALDFLEQHHLTPQEIFFVGRVAKGRQLALVRETVSLPTSIFYFEDSYRHSRNSRLQDVEGLKTYYIDWSKPNEFAPEELLLKALKRHARHRRAA